MLTGEDNLVRAGEAVRRLGPKFVILKKGEHGAMLFSEDGVFVVPAYPTADVIDPTGAGDSFAGGIMGYLESDRQPAARPAPPRDGVRHRGRQPDGRGVRPRPAHGAPSRGEIDQRLEQYRQMMAF